MTPAVHVHLEELMVQGIAPSDRHRVSESLTRELTRLLSEHGIPDALSRGGTAPRLDAGSFVLRAGLQPEQYGERVAEAVYRSLGGRLER